MIICTELGRRGHELQCSLCWQLMRASGWMAAQELNQLMNPVSERSTSAVATARFPDFVQQHWMYIAQAPPHLPLRMSEILPATAPRAARGRADAAEAAGCTVVATAKLAPLSSKIPPLPPPRAGTVLHVV
jgi:hypothetical protein